MTLNEKFLAVLHQTKPHFVNVDADICEQIADDFAVGFSEWNYKHGRFIQENLTTKQLLEIYKKETNGLR